MSSTATPENIHVDPAPWTSGYPGWWKHRVGCGWVVSINLATVNFACPMVFLCCPLENNVREEEQIQKVTKSNCTLQVFGGKVIMHVCYVVIGWHPIKNVVSGTTKSMGLSENMVPPHIPLFHHHVFHYINGNSSFLEAWHGWLNERFSTQAVITFGHTITGLFHLFPTSTNCPFWLFLAVMWMGNC